MNEDFKRNGYFNNVQQPNNYQLYHQNNMGGLQRNNTINFVGNFDDIMKYFAFYARKFVRFSQNIPGLEKNLSHF